MTHFSSRNASEKERFEKTQESLIKSVELKFKDTIDDLNSKIEHLEISMKDKNKYHDKEKADLQETIKKLQNNDFLKLKSKYEEN